MLLLVGYLGTEAKFYFAVPGLPGNSRSKSFVGYLAIPRLPTNRGSMFFCYY